MKNLIKIGKELFPICRSLTGSGNVKTLKILKREIPNLKIKKIKSGTKVFDWTVPPQWDISDAYIKDQNNNRIIDFKKNNLHLVGYSKPFKKIITKKILLKNLYSIEKLPDAIPYVTSYYKKAWGFCLSYNSLKKLNKDYSDNHKFKVCINSKFKKNGHMHYAEYLIPGKSKKEILISTYICHPSMANNELSGPLVALGLIRHFQNQKNKISLRFIFISETIGSIAYISTNLRNIKKNVLGGINLTCVGDERNYSLLMSKYKDSILDKVAKKVLKKNNIKYKSYSFLERGSDERQFSSPGVDLPFISVMRTKYGKFPEYHTSLDNFDLVTNRGLSGSINIIKKIIKILVNYNEEMFKKETILRKKISKNPRTNIICEPFLTKRKMYPTLSRTVWNQNIRNYLNFIQYADGFNSLDEISKIIKLKKPKTKKLYNHLKFLKIVI
jgi:aminopeptidase-like protein|tara:strand:- start:1210 stop:2535 length:1326 start_codon:yes stop_codon:yes gene_type:complete